MMTVDTRRQVRLGDRDFDVYDLTHPIRPETEVFPGDPTVERSVFASIDETGFEHYVHRLGDHVFSPHADAPSHQNPDRKGVGVEVWGPEFEFNEALAIDLTAREASREIDGIAMVTRIERAHVEPLAEELGRCGAVVVRTGADRWRVAGRPWSPEVIPGFTADAGRFLASFDGLRVVATDSLTVDVVRPDDPIHDVHRAFRDKLIVESLTHVDRLPFSADGTARFTLQTALLPIVGATGCPVVARAWFVRGSGA